MPHDVTMPQLGMAQDAGRIVAWLKKPGDKVARGDALFEVETDKATMEVEAQSDGFLTDVAAAEGEDVPVGHVIARISDTADDARPSIMAPGPAAGGATPPPPGTALPEGHAVTMPQLGMAQDAGIVVAWRVAPGDRVVEGDALFDVETDKATMEVEASASGYVAALLAAEGEEVPVGEPVAIIAAEQPAVPLRRSRAAAGAPAPTSAPTASALVATVPTPVPASAPSAPPPAPPPPVAAEAGRVLASPKARRLARELGLDLARLAEAGHRQPFHVRDLDALKALYGSAASAADAAPAAAGVQAARRIAAEIPEDGFSPFAAWAAEAAGQSDDLALLAGFAAASLRSAVGRESICVMVERFGTERRYVDPDRVQRPTPAETEAPAADLLLRDLRAARLVSLECGAEAVPALTITKRGAGLAVTLDCSASQLSAAQAVGLVDGFAGRLEDPLRHLL